MAGCRGADDEPARDESLGGPTASTALTPQQVRAREQRVLDRRAEAVREGDLGKFLERVDPTDRRLVARQTRYFRSVSQLPLRTFRYELLPGRWPGVEPDPAWGAGGSVGRARLLVQLDGFDVAPVQRLVGFGFALREGRPWIVADRTSTGRPLTEGDPAPWDLTSVTVRRAPGALGLFDRGTRGDGAAVTRAVSEGIEEVARFVPFRWNQDVVVYSFTDPDVLATFTDVPGGALDHLGALTFPVYAEGRRRASTRMLVMPTSVAAGQPFLGRITRHELSHIAVGRHDDGAPTWLSEGLAEYVGARPLARSERIIPTPAVQRAQEPQTGMPPSLGFNGQDQEWHYALSWMACDWIAATRGEAALWQLVRQMHNGGAGTSDAEQDMVLESVLGLDSRALAERAAARIRAIYG